MLKLYFRVPMTGTYIEDGVSKSWAIHYFECPPLELGQSPPADGLILNFGKSLVDADGEPIPSWKLREYDLDKGLGDVLRDVWR